MENLTPTEVQELNTPRQAVGEGDYPLAEDLNDADFQPENDELNLNSEGEMDEGYIDSETSYHSLYSSSESDENEEIEEDAGDSWEMDTKNPVMEIGSRFFDACHFRRALEHFSVLGEFIIKYIKSDQKRVTARCNEDDCPWRIHGSMVPEHRIFQVKTMIKDHTCSSVNKCGNKMATQFWIADRITDWLREYGELPIPELRRRLVEKYHVELPYHRIWRGKEVALENIHGNWDESYVKIMDFKEELMRRNPGSVIKLEQEIIGRGCHFKRFFVCLGASSTGFLVGCSHRHIFFTNCYFIKYQGRRQDC